MPKPPKPASAHSSGDDRNLVVVDDTYLAPTFEDRLRIFWEKNARAIVAGCVLVLVVILGKGAYDYVVAQREKALAEEFGAAKDAQGDESLKAFVASHDDHVLGGLAQLTLADRAYSAGNYSDARTAYDKAAGILKNNPFGQRARVGSAVSAVQAGATAEGEAALKQIVADLSLDKLYRAEAAYHLASRAAESGNAAEAIRLIEQVTVIDAESHWADRASMLRSSLPTQPVDETPAETTATPVSTESADAAPSVIFK